MDLKTLIPLISTVVGGFLAVTGGFFASYFMQKLNKSHDKKQLIRDKLEQAYLLTIQLENWLQSQMSDMLFIKDNETEKISNPSNHIFMLVKCYGETKSSQLADQLSTSLENFRKSSFNYFKEAHETGKKPSETTFLAVGEPFEMSRRLTTELRDNIEKLIHKNT